MNRAARAAFLPLLLALAAGSCEKIDRNMWDNPARGPQSAPAPPAPEGSVPTKGAYHRPTPAEAARMTNPLAPSKSDLARGKELFGVFCVPCHGDSGKGDGPVGKKLAERPSNIGPQGMLPSLSDGDIFGIITNGSGPMPSFAADLPIEERWRIVAWLRSTAKK